MFSNSSSHQGLSWAAERHRFIEAGGNTSHAFGLGRMIGRAYAMLYLATSPMSLDEIAATLRVSKASASTVLRQLASWQAVRQIWVAGDRKDYYEAETDFSVILKEGLMPGVRKKLQTAGTQIEKTLQSSTQKTPATPANEEMPPADQAEIRRRLRSAQQLHQRLDKVLGSKLLARFL
ncbi:GbsR/MarR family transcriptional regulator [Verrucomicrobium spinosum]|uniref:GbsR/MarR family transcriptional regulator n=2 Tax=Verrucomicrobium spinosum TaxID=2736 RepID=UPI0006A72405|nr:hypothetical protein [Verrucomicrobium spinosum]